ncbi:alpha/beta fold hydrolase [Rhizobium leguminosarum]|uniref:alpha/beta fold hydrolase n=1 Tax=Rhizobium leguminosarum TaxID=384 RepID=UPI0004BA2159|nr:alpha/beta hydrolase [Rhizobium leguminosarum]
MDANVREARSTRVPMRPTYPAPRSSRIVDIEGLEHGLIEVDDEVRLHYVVAGEGEPVVLVPGWPQSWYAWRFVIPRLAAAGRRVYAIDPRGFGDSDKPAEGYDLETVSRDLHNFIDRLGLNADGPVDIVGHDVGTWIVHAHAANYQSDVRRLVVTDATIPGVSPPPPAGYPDKFLNSRSWHFGFNRVLDLPEALIHGREREFLQWFFGAFKSTRLWTIDNDAFEEYLRVFAAPGGVRSGLNYYRQVFSAQGIAASAERCKTSLKMPILCLGGSDADGDNLLKTMSQFSTDVRSIVFEGVGHHLPEECPEELSDAIIRFWQER